MLKVALLAGVTVLATAAPAVAVGNPDVAALQVALRSHGFYAGAVDGVAGSGTKSALISFQKRMRLVPDGIPGPRTRRALGRLGAPELGARRLEHGSSGWDVAELQFLLAWHGFPSGRFDGVFGDHLEAAVRRFQRFAGLPTVGFAGPRTIGAVRSPAIPTSPIRLSWPVQASLGDGFGPRGGTFHAGLDFQAVAGARVAAARAGRVVWAGPRGNFGNTVVIAHGRGVRTLYAHLSVVSVVLGERVGVRSQLGLVGATGRVTGPHLHFEVRVRGAAVDPLGALRC
jgi:murein DD-endopeptidase MepM/ murein hydrolase activator NlpD